ncbi:MAG: hypothetical protein HY706_19115 [Candidatus Hydrogenedentes bacterium]|nr:hypothetical protein [Candidatus Hydrogenedentota bacterium]
MVMKTVALVLVLGLATGLMLGLVTTQVSAGGLRGGGAAGVSDVSSSYDEMGGKKGAKGKKKEGPAVWQMALGIGSIFVMIAVVKWL